MKLCTTAKKPITLKLLMTTHTHIYGTKIISAKALMW